MKRRTFLKNAAAMSGLAVLTPSSVFAQSPSKSALFTSSKALAELEEPFRSWNSPVEPFKMIGNIYYVGARDVSSFLITTQDGHILIEGGFAQTAPLIEKNISTLGLQPEDVKLLLTSHAHFDHAGGLAALKRITGATLIASQPEADMLARGGKGDFHFGDKILFPPVTTDRIIKDAEQIQLGTVTLTAYLTPGHTKGCTTWTMKMTEHDKSYDVVFMGSISIPGYTLKNNANYPKITEDYAYSFKYLKTLPCDIFLAPHSWDFALRNKMNKRDGKANPFIDPEGYQKAIGKAEQKYKKSLDLE